MEVHTTAEHKQSYRRREATRQYSFCFSFFFFSLFSLPLAFFLSCPCSCSAFLLASCSWWARLVLPRKRKFGVRLSFFTARDLRFFWSRAWPRHHRSSRGRAGDPGLSVEGACRKRRPYVVQHSIAAAYPQSLGERMSMARCWA